MAAGELRVRQLHLLAVAQRGCAVLTVRVQHCHRLGICESHVVLLLRGRGALSVGGRGGRGGGGGGLESRQRCWDRICCWSGRGRLGSNRLSWLLLRIICAVSMRWGARLRCRASSKVEGVRGQWHRYDGRLDALRSRRRQYRRRRLTEGYNIGNTRTTCSSRRRGPSAWSLCWSRHNR